MKPRIQNEEFLTPEVALPVQFQHMWHESSAVTPERALAVSVLWQAVSDLQKYRVARWGKRQRLYRDAHRWVVSNDREWPYSFINICEALGLSPQSLRAQLLRPDAPPVVPPQNPGPWVAAGESLAAVTLKRASA
ncbi:MAG: hypothetical protein ACHQ4J_03090 [Candidatus Binatia bacterium]